MEELSAEKRREKIIEMLNHEGKLKVSELSQLFGISEVTIRKDLSRLEKTHVLKRTRGGAVSTNNAYYFMSLNDRMRTNEDEKRRIAAAVRSLVQEGDAIIINSGTTTYYVTQELRDFKSLTVVTNFLPIAQVIGVYKNIRTILLGGNVDPHYQYTYGNDTIEQLQKYRADKLILAVDGISFEGGVTTYYNLEAEVCREMIKRANQVIVAADYSKIGRIGFNRIDLLDNIDYLITDSKADKDEISLIREKGVEVRLV